MKWAYGVTTVPQRLNEQLPKTLCLLHDAGFTDPVLFVDGCDSLPLELADYKAVFRAERIRANGNWTLAMWELYLRNPFADRYAIFQDDIICVKGMRQYLEACDYPAKGYLNLYTFPDNEKRAPKKGGWYLSNQQGKGGLGLVFSNEALTTLLGARHFVHKCKGKNGHKSLDGNVVTSMKNAGFKEYCHSPSLLQHQHGTSTVGNNVHPMAPSFPGPDFDATTLIGKPVLPEIDVPAPMPRAADLQACGLHICDESDPSPDAPSIGVMNVAVVPGPVIKDSLIVGPPSAADLQACGVVLSREEVEALDKPAVEVIEDDKRIGLIGFNDASGLGELNRQIHNYLPIEEWAIIPHGSRPVGKTPPGNTSVIQRTNRNGIAEFLDNVDTVVFTEVPYSPHMVSLAKKKGKRLVCVPMMEWVPVGGWISQVDLFVCPTRQCYDLYKDELPCVYFPWPVDNARFTFKPRKTAKSFLFVNGNGGWNNRKGGHVIKAAKLLWPDMPLMVVSQKRAEWPRGTIVIEPTKENYDLYSKGDILLCPHSIDGLGLEPMEAMACGMPVISTDGLPWNEFPSIAKIDAEVTRKKIQREVDWYRVSPESLVEQCKQLLGSDIAEASYHAKEWAVNRSFSSQAAQLTELIRKA